MNYEKSKTSNKISIKIKLRSYNSLSLDKTATNIVSKIKNEYEYKEIIGPIAIPRKMDFFSKDKDVNIQRTENQTQNNLVAGAKIKYLLIFVKEVDKQIIENKLEIQPGVSIEINIEF